MQIGYCTNVHAGSDLATTQANLEEHALDVKARYSPHDPMGIGLWLSAGTANDLLAGNELSRFSEWLHDNALVPFTLNGFPYGDFHQPIVKHEVYKPTWRDNPRLEYTKSLAVILDRLLPEKVVGSISTLPLEWGTPAPSDETMTRHADALIELAAFLHQQHQSTGRLIHVCIEPEPGCVLQYSTDVVSLFDRYLFQRCPNHLDIAKYLRVCHDVCHGSVMFEEQDNILERYESAGIRIGKVQVSSAIRAPLDSDDDHDNRETLDQLRQFSEDRYLHQTVVQNAQGDTEFFEDLHQAISRHEASPSGEWRVHYHVPIYLESFGRLRSTRDHIAQCLQGVKKHSNVAHFEVETYAWNVLPVELQVECLAEGIANELTWFDTLVRETNLSSQP